MKKEATIHDLVIEQRIQRDATRNEEGNCSSSVKYGERKKTKDCIQTCDSQTEESPVLTAQDVTGSWRVEHKRVVKIAKRVEKEGKRKGRRGKGKMLGRSQTV